MSNCIRHMEHERATLDGRKRLLLYPCRKKPLLEVAFDINLKTERKTLENYKRCFISLRLPPMPKDSCYAARRLGGVFFVARHQNAER